MVPGFVNDGQLGSPRGTLHDDGDEGRGLARCGQDVLSFAFRCVAYHSSAQYGSSCHMCTWLKRSRGKLPWYSTIAASGPRRYAQPPVGFGLTPLALASAICALVKFPGHESVLTV